jgi:glycine cleavage system H lipoate-binding protein
MVCPFLRETRVRHCHAAAVRKLIAAAQGDNSAELCSNPDYVTCRVYQAHADGTQVPGNTCPYLHEGLAHYCGAAPVLRFVPYTEQSGRCGSNGYPFCETYLAIERAGQRISAPRSGDIRVPSDLFYAPNHMWLHRTPNGVCHIGIDEFFASVAGPLDSVSFVTTSGVQRPTAVLTLHGIDCQISFKNRMLITAAHLYLRSSPAPLTSDPYGAGWLFEGWPVPDAPIDAGLMSGQQALAWMDNERARLDELVHQFAATSSDADPTIVNDGGSAVRNAVRHLGREQSLRMMHALFSSDRDWREEAVR